MSGDNNFIGRDSVCGSGSGDAIDEHCHGNGGCGGCDTDEHYNGNGGVTSASDLDFRFVRNAVLGGSKYWRS